MKKRPQNRYSPVNIAKFLIILIPKNICERLLFDFFNDSLFRWPKVSRPRLCDGVRLQGLTHRSSFLFLSRHEPDPSPRLASENLRRIAFDGSIKLLYWLFLVVLDGFSSFQVVFRSSQVVLDHFSSFLSLVSINSLNSFTNSFLNLYILKSTVRL